VAEEHGRGVSRPAHSPRIISGSAAIPCSAGWTRTRNGLGQVATEAAAGASCSFSDEPAAVSSYYAARIAAARAGLSPRDIAGALRAIRNEQTVAVRAVLEKWSAARAMTKKSYAIRTTATMRPVAGHDPS
jgi:hypothetical protein